MTSGLTSGERELADRLEAALNEGVSGSISADPSEIATELARWYCGEDDRPVDEMAARILELTSAPGGDLADLQERLAAVLDRARPSADEDPLPALLGALAREALDREATPEPTGAPDEPEHLPARGHEFLQAVIDALGDPVFVKDADHRWILLNDAYCEFMGYDREQLLGESDYDFFPEQEADVFWDRDDEVLQSGRVDENEETFTDADGNKHVIITKKSRFVDAEGDKYLVGIIRDVTERKRLEARLDVARRLMSLGTLASGIAHEINNPLSYVLTNLDYLLETRDETDESDDERREALEAALRGAQRVQEVIQGLSTFSEVSDEELQPVNVDEILQSTVGVAAEKIRRHARLEQDYGQVPPVAGNERSLNQIFFNLLTNATEAIEAAEADRNHEVRVRTTTGPDGDAVIEISDTGEGIPPDIREHIFDPFFTTRPVGEGTGLGLAVCHGLVEAMHGHIEVDSEPGAGSTFRIVLPPADRTPPPDATAGSVDGATSD